MKALDLVGMVFSRLTVIERAGSIRKKSAWRCRCICGNETILPSDALRMGVTKSCGCQKRDSTIQTMQRIKKTHGMSSTSEYKIWIHIKQRCQNPKYAMYPDYGARGITICPEWDASFEAFYASMGPRPSLAYSIDRKDVNGNYEPGNCRWATDTEQANNRRNNNYITLNGVSRTITQWSAITGLHATTIRQRLKLGWTAERAMTRLRSTS
jgi:hypothetical protein